MKKLSQKEKEKILSRIFWDLSIDSDDFSDMLETPGGETPSIRQINLCRRLLVSCDWYTIIKMFSFEKIGLMLSDTVIEGLYPKDIQGKYIYAREYLSR